MSSVAMNKKDLEELIQVLGGARQRLHDGREMFVCIALSNECIDRYECHHHYFYDYLRLWVESMLGGYYTLAEWVDAQYQGGDSYEVNMRESRLQWIDWMIRELKTEIRGMK